MFASMFFPEVINEANRSPRRATGASTNTSKPIAPMTAAIISLLPMKPQLLIFSLLSVLGTSGKSGKEQRDGDRSHQPVAQAPTGAERRMEREMGIEPTTFSLGS